MRTTISQFWRRLHETTIWRYAPETPPELLVRHYRRSMAVMGVAFWLGGLMFASMLEMLLSEPGWWRTFWVFVAIPASLVSVVTLIPSVVANAWAHETARECVDRGIPGICPETADSATRKMAMKSVGYFATILLASNVIGRDPALRPVAVAIWTLFSGASLVWILRTSRTRPA